jgi:enoyl-CoA hydratase/carnithine racemase
MTRHILEPLEFKHLLYGRRDAVATITINRPDNRNALGTDTVKELRQAFDQAKRDEAVRVIVLTGAGKVFCAGADLQGFQVEISELGKPTIARVNGHALAGGFGLVAACDLAIASDAAQFGMPGWN